MWEIVLLGHILSTTGDALNIIPAESRHQELDEQITTLVNKHNSKETLV
jgi:hypothetical protein